MKCLWHTLVKIQTLQEVFTLFVSVALNANDPAPLFCGMCRHVSDPHPIIHVWGRILENILNDEVQQHINVICDTEQN